LQHTKATESILIPEFFLCLSVLSTPQCSQPLGRDFFWHFDVLHVCTLRTTLERFAISFLHGIVWVFCDVTARGVVPRLVR
jgi:hypothetical protein